MAKRIRGIVLGIAVVSSAVALLDLLGIRLLARWELGSFLALDLLAASAGWQIVRLLGASSDWQDRLLDAGVVTLAVIVLVELVLGTLGWLYLNLLVLVMGLITAGLWCLPWRLAEPSPPAHSPGTHSLRDWLAGGLLAGLALLAALQVVWARWLTPPDTTDALSYHLPFAVEWIQNHNLTMPIPAAGGPATPFYPLNASLWMTSLILPFGSDVMVRIAQAPFVGLVMLAVVRLGRLIGLSRGAVWAMGLLAATQPSIARDAFVAENDLILAALLLAAAAYIGQVWCSAQPRPAVLGAVSLGLALGTKTAALPYVALLSALYAAAIVRSWRRGGWLKVAGWWAAAALVVACLGSYSYVRNLAVMGNPFYPVTVRLGDQVTLPGLYQVTKAWKQHHPFYPFDWKGLVLSSRSEFGWVIPVWILPGLGLCLWRIGRDRHVGAVLLLLGIVAAVAAFWFVLPYHFARFLYAPICAALVAAAWGWHGIARRHAYWLVVAAVPLLAVNALSIPKHARAWESPTYWLAAVGVVAAAMAIALAARRLGTRRLGIIFAVGAATGLTAVVTLWPTYERVYEEHRPGAWQSYPGGAQPQAWAWLTGETNSTAGADRIAVVGTGVILPLCGPALKNRLSSLRSDGGIPGYNWGLAYHPPGPPDQVAWLETVEREAIGYLYVTRDAAADEWPAEDRWAAGDSQHFALLFSNDLVHIWRRQ